MIFNCECAPGRRPRTVLPTGLCYTAELFPTQIRGTAVGASYALGFGIASLAPTIMGWIATASSVAAGLPLLALSFAMLVPLFVYFAPEMTRKDLTDLIGQEAAESDAGV